MLKRAAATGLLLAISASAQAADLSFEDATSRATFGLRGGVMTGTGHEYVYYDDGAKMSELIWDMQYNYTLTADVDLRMTRHWLAYASATVGLNGNNTMNDYDWLGYPFFPGVTHHSWHEDTRLDRYVSLNGQVGYDFLARDDRDLMLLGGFKYTNVQWTASGGCYNYPGDTGCLPAGIKTISYEQTMPALYAGLGAGARFGKFSVAAKVLGGVNISPSDFDTHWLRGLTFLDNFGASPYVGADARLTYAVNDQLGLTLAATYDHHFTAKGPTIVNGSSLIPGDVAGGSLETLNISAGLAYSF